MGSGPTADALEHIVFSGHVAAPEPSVWWGRVLFITRLEIAAWAPYLHAVVKGMLGLCFVAEGLLGRSNLRLKLFV
jgi:hypothetical protein